MLLATMLSREPEQCLHCCSLPKSMTLQLDVLIIL